MGRKTKKIKAAGKFGAGFGTSVRINYNTIESLQRKSQPCPFHKNCRAKRIAAGIWQCKKTGKTFAGHAYYLRQTK